MPREFHNPVLEIEYPDHVLAELVYKLGGRVVVETPSGFLEATPVRLEGVKGDSGIVPANSGNSRLDNSPDTSQGSGSQIYRLFRRFEPRLADLRHEIMYTRP